MPIDKKQPELDRIVSPDQAIEELGKGFGGSDGPAEGPLWWKEGGYLLFSDIHNNRRMKWAPGSGWTISSGACFATMVAALSGTNIGTKSAPMR